MKCHLFFPHIHTVALFSTVWSTNTIVGTFAFSANISRADKINGNHSPKIRKLKYEFYRLRRAHAHATNTLHFNAVVCRCANRTLLIILTCTLPSLFITMKAHSTPTHFDVKIGRQKKGTHLVLIKRHKSYNIFRHSLLTIIAICENGKHMAASFIGSIASIRCVCITLIKIIPCF